MRGVPTAHPENLGALTGTRKAWFGPRQMANQAVTTECKIEMMLLKLKEPEEEKEDSSWGMEGGVGREGG